MSGSYKLYAHAPNNESDTAFFSRLFPAPDTSSTSTDGKKKKKKSTTSGSKSKPSLSTSSSSFPSFTSQSATNSPTRDYSSSSSSSSSSSFAPSSAAAASSSSFSNHLAPPGGKSLFGRPRSASTEVYHPRFILKDGKKSSAYIDGQINSLTADHDEEEDLGHQNRDAYDTDDNDARISKRYLGKTSLDGNMTLHTLVDEPLDKLKIDDMDDNNEGYKKSSRRKSLF